MSSETELRRRIRVGPWRAFVEPTCPWPGACTDEEVDGIGLSREGHRDFGQDGLAILQLPIQLIAIAIGESPYDEGPLLQRRSKLGNAAVRVFIGHDHPQSACQQFTTTDLTFSLQLLSHGECVELRRPASVVSEVGWQSQWPPLQRIFWH